MSEDVTIGPLRCIVCGEIVGGPHEWVHAHPGAPIYGLHQACTEKACIRGWRHDGSPIRMPSLEQRVTSLENQLDRYAARVDELSNRAMLSDKPITVRLWTS